MTSPAPDDALPEAQPTAGTWVVLPTYDEAANLPGHLASDPRRAAGLHAARRGRCVARRHRRARRRARGRASRASGCSTARASRASARAYIDGFRVALAGGAQRVVQMDADWSHSPAYLPSLVAAIDDGADLVIGSRYTAGGGVRDWGLMRQDRLARRLDLRADRAAPDPARPDGWLQGVAARAPSAAIDWSRVHAGGYVFQIEMTYLASRAGARVAEVPIVFTDRQVGESKMSRRIIAEALMVVLRLRWDGAARAGPPGGASARRTGL